MQIFFQSMTAEDGYYVETADYLDNSQQHNELLSAAATRNKTQV